MANRANQSKGDNSFFHLEHRRLRERFSMETLTRHEDRLMAALYARREAIRAARVEQQAA